MKLYQNLFRDFNEMFIGHAALAIVPSSCLGSIAAMLILMQGHTFGNMFELFIVVTACMIFNAAVLAQLKPKFVFNSLLLSIVVSIVFILINLL
ncbi:hypothetical protein L1I30_00860 [Gillisia sp. M10.2A]|uniref:Uncharacterized protein n=1 Tax=Gillisia lutea TaxID=2909668 RepID=A0ABS9EBE4_9FLAO|nr:hypothetical protein [Gillisia lutea]MCF4100205.1 hypothetical protein [Gillisia lutea]